MRLIVACGQCHRQYEAASRKIGSRFRCYCGEMVVVAPPKGHDAAVVRCSACGAPREEGAKRCRFCNSDFTLHERDLDTVCPACLARVSDQAKFCHYCGTAITPELSAGDASKLYCPSCTDEKRSLVNRNLGELAVNVLECQQCGGMWLGVEIFKNLTTKVQRQAAIGASSNKEPPRATLPENKNWAYRRCIICQEFMHRRNFAGSSGVIIDICHDHGIWFDDHELHQLVEWIREGGAVPAKSGLPAAKKASADRPVIGKWEPNDGGFFEGEVLTDRRIASVFAVIARLAVQFFFRM